MTCLEVPAMLLFAHVVTRVLGSVAGLGAHAPLRYINTTSGHAAPQSARDAVAIHLPREDGTAPDEEAHRGGRCVVEA